MSTERYHVPIATRRKPAKRSRPTRDETRARLLRAAGKVFAERGYERASLDEVAAAAGLTKGAVYSSFASKGELFYALMDERIGERLALFEQAVDRDATLDEVTQDAGEALSELMSSQADWQLLFIEFWAQAMRDPGLRDEFARHRRAAREVIARFIQRQADQGGVELPVSADQLAVALLAVSNGIAIERLADPDSVDPSTLGVVLRLMLRGVEVPAA